MKRIECSRRQFITRSAGLAVLGVAASQLRAEETAGRWQIGCYTRPWAAHDYRTAFDAIAEAGFKFAGLMLTNSKARLVIHVETTEDEARVIGEAAKQRGLKIASTYGGGFPAGKSLAAGIAGLKKLIDNCAACGSANLLLGGTSDAKVQDTYYQCVAECCDYAVAKGVDLSVKPHGGLNATGPQCRALVERVGHKNFRIYYDPGNILYYSQGELDPVADAASVDGLVSGLCVKDYQPPKQVELTPGTGRVNFPAVFARLKQGGFTGGPLVVECLAPGDLPALAAEARKARLFLEQLTA
jgi:sugar phosphate isomerase/epimerase